MTDLKVWKPIYTAPIDGTLIRARRKQVLFVNGEVRKEEQYICSYAFNKGIDLREGVGNFIVLLHGKYYIVLPDEWTEL